MPAITPALRPRVVVDADACVPAELRRALGIVCAPGEPAVVTEREAIRWLAPDAGPLPGSAIAGACAAVAEPGGAVIYVRTGDGYGSPDDAGGAAREAVEARGAAFHLLATGAALMAAGWAAVCAAEAIGAGAGAEAAVAAGRRAAAAAGAIAMLEHPELAGLVADRGRGVTTRVLVRIEGATLPLLAAVPRRETALAALRDRFAALVAAGGGAGALRVAVHHAGSAAAAGAMALWIERHLAPAQTVVAPLTRHAATRLGPGMVGLAWTWEPPPSDARGV
ncbi:MAG: hypothetical protein EXR65_05700 [Dehalococcoidia bacterium]|nr:hypothetical protein [Dehalococcoidia bacterium]